MKIDYPALIVVEGASDKAFLTSFLNAEIVVTNGSEVSRETIEFIKEASTRKSVVVLTDPDFPGKKIRDKLDSQIPGLKHVFIPKEKAIKGHKVGVAESDKETVLQALSFLLEEKAPSSNALSMSDLFDLGLVGAESSSSLREKVMSKLHLGYGNAKTFLKRANAMGLTKGDLEKAIHG